MSNSLKEVLKNEVDKLKVTLEDVIHDLYMAEKSSYIKHLEIKKIDNDLGYISLDIFEQTDLSILLGYKKLLEKYSKQLNQV